VDAKRELERFIGRYSCAVRDDAERTLAHLEARLPTASRLIYDNYNALVIAFSANERPSGIFLSIALYPRYVTLFFLDGVRLPDPEALLEGSGTRVRGIRLCPVSRLESAAVGALIDAAVANAAPLAKAGAGKLIVQSISAKQRPRRPS
jgi:hypothetical protein